ncbi:hypothetical protein IMCC20628_04350 [Hoeflea sp. IMCC20628]|uniref:hypothetical protein n=1 Tax=Hoeflea sp. IMCC20628 TaxID=1620421 RepID=UPI00063A9EA1|nr:hypothetical protein [Hoeflea sp. IMCC20628]AKI03025.1 hypothetical protein IMCC20628_04350 [Hoeflea sp. IMCC20628]
MLTKSILTLAAASLATILIQAPAQASDSSRNVRDHRAAAEVQVRDHRIATQPKVRDHRATRKNEVVKVSRKDCRAGAENLRRSGYRQIKMLDCQGTEYSYLAQKHHALFGARMNAYSGTLKVSYIGPVKKH